MPLPRTDGAVKFLDIEIVGLLEEPTCRARKISVKVYVNRTCYDDSANS